MCPCHSADIIADNALATPSKWPSTLVLPFVVAVVHDDDDNDDDDDDDDFSVIVPILVLVVVVFVAVVWRRYCPLGRGNALNFINPIHAKSVEMCRTESVYPCANN